MDFEEMVPLRTDLVAVRNSTSIAHMIDADGTSVCGRCELDLDELRETDSGHYTTTDGPAFWDKVGIYHEDGMWVPNETRLCSECDEMVTDEMQRTEFDPDMTKHIEGFSI